MKLEKKILSMVDYSTRGESFREVKLNDIKEIISKYYFQDYTLNQIIKEYNIASNKSKIIGDLPKLSDGRKCKYDGTSMYIKIPSKENFKRNFINEEEYICLLCNHKTEDSCKCLNCQETEKQKVRDSYGNRQIDKNLEEMTLSERIKLATLLQGFHVKSLREDFGSYKIFNDVDSPLFLEDHKSLVELFHSNSIKVSEHSDIEVFKFKDGEPSHFYPVLANWYLNIKSKNDIYDEDLFTYLKYPNASIIDNKDEVNKMWNEIVTEELIRLFNYQLIEFNFIYNHDNDHDKIVDYFNGLYKLLKPAQIYALIWMSVRQADNSRTRGTWGNFKYNHVNFILKLMEDLRIKKANNGEIIQEYDFPYTVNVSLLAKVFFDQVVLCSNWFALTVPLLEENSGVNHKIREFQFYEGLLSREKQVDSFTVPEFSYYYLTKFGIAAFDGMVTWLFSDEKILYQLYKSFPSEEVSKDNENFYLDLDIPYYIEEIYSTSFLLELIQFFIASGIDNYLPDSDSEQVADLEEKLINSYEN